MGNKSLTSEEVSQKISEFLGVKPEFLQDLSKFTHILNYISLRKIEKIDVNDDMAELKNIFCRMRNIKPPKYITIYPERPVEANLGLTKENISTIRSLEYWLGSYRNDFYSGRINDQQIKAEVEGRVKNAFDSFKAIPVTNIHEQSKFMAIVHGIKELFNRA